MSELHLNQLSFFGENHNEFDWESQWHGMPEYVNTQEKKPEITATFKFRTFDDFYRFKSVIQKELYGNEKVFDGNQKKEEKNAWYPLKEKSSRYKYVSTSKIHPKFPIYIVTKGRWNRNPTSKALSKMGVSFWMIVEESEYENYCNLIDSDRVLILPTEYRKNYDSFWIDDDERTGPGPARNYAWDHSIEQGYTHHWVMDDNIEAFERLNKNKKVKCMDGTIFKVAENFVDRYENVAISGLGYSFFCPEADARPPYKLNTRIYSCLMIRNDIPYRWRGRYNEDTDLSLRALKDGWCTLQFNAFLQSKRATQTVGGGNTSEFYKNEGTMNKSKMLQEMHPDVSEVKWMFNRWHHHVDYSPFRWTKLKLKKGQIIGKGINNFGMSIHKDD